MLSLIAFTQILTCLVGSSLLAELPQSAEDLFVQPAGYKAEPVPEESVREATREPSQLSTTSETSKVIR